MLLSLKIGRSGCYHIYPFMLQGNPIARFVRRLSIFTGMSDGVERERGSVRPWAELWRGQRAKFEEICINFETLLKSTDSRIRHISR